MACPQCLNDTLEKFIDVTFCVPSNITAISKTNIRNKNIKIVSANWDKVRWYCSDCGWYMNLDSCITDFSMSKNE